MKYDDDQSELEDLVNGAESEEEDNSSDAKDTDSSKADEEKGSGSKDDSESGSKDDKDDSKDDESDSDKEDETASSDKDDSEEESESVPKAALLDERRKRQELEKRLEALESKTDQDEEEQEEEEERPDIFEDQEAAFQYIENKIGETALSNRIALSRDFMMMLKDDFQEKEKVFMELAKTDKRLTAELVRSPNPARFAYETAVKHEAGNDIGDDPEAWREKERQKIREEERARLKKELGSKTGDEDQDESDVDETSLANASGSGEKGGSDKGETLDDVVLGDHQ